jgi:Ni,Fe-hydrogenase III small subunit/formate hydrogenlyase subunit 6/NADH:ubiquinone oxidoreductase subunit I
MICEGNSEKIMLGKIRKKKETSEGRISADNKDLEKHLQSRMTSDIMSDNVETIKDPINEYSNSQEFRGSIKLLDAIIHQDSLDELCAAKAIKIDGGSVMLDAGKCILCGRCEQAAPEIFRIGSASETPTRARQDMIKLSGKLGNHGQKPYEQIGTELKEKISKILHRSLAIREIDAGSCNGCEVEIIALNNAIYDIERFGIHFVASPRHADVLLVTGPASRNMEIALRRTFDATPDPKIVVAVGACACSGGIFGDTYATTGGIDKVVPVDIYIPGCPPTPQAILYGLLLAVDRIAEVNKTKY